MGFYNNSGTVLSAFLRVNLTTAGVLTAAGTGQAIGVLDYDSASGDYATVRLPTCPGSRKYIANTLISAFATVYTATGGMVGISSLSAITLGIANAVQSGAPVAATSNGAILEVLPIEGGTLP